MRERPIIFSTPMVQAILEGRKTMTRRICKHQHWQHSELVDVNVNGITNKVDRKVSCPYGEIGDRLWVRETCLIWTEDGGDTVYKTDINYDHCRQDMLRLKKMGYPKDGVGNWKVVPSIYMPRAACRIVLEITNIRAELLQTISINDVEKEGIKPGVMMFIEFSNLWERINGKGSWQKPTYVWVIEFRRVQAC